MGTAGLGTADTASRNRSSKRHVPTAAGDPPTASQDLNLGLGASTASFLSSLQAEQLSPDECEATMSELRHAQRLLEAGVAAITRRLIDLEADGVGPATEAVPEDAGHVTSAQASREKARAETLTAFPSLSRAFDSGSVPSANVDVLAKVADSLDSEELETFTQLDSSLAEAATELGVDSFSRRIRRTRDKIRHDGGRKAQQQAVDDSFLNLSFIPTRQGYKVNGFLDAERGHLLQRYLEREVNYLKKLPEAYSPESDVRQNPGKTPCNSWLASQALVGLVSRSDAIDPETIEVRPNYVVNVHVDHDTLTDGPHAESTIETEDGTPLSADTVARICCDSALRLVRNLPDSKVYVSHTGRTATPAQRAALRALYPNGCPISGTSWRHVEIHHTIFYQESKHTILDELVPISKRWHHRIHDEGWRLEMDTDRTLRLYRPNGTLDRTILPPAQPNSIQPLSTQGVDCPPNSGQPPPARIVA